MPSRDEAIKGMNHKEVQGGELPEARKLGHLMIHPSSLGSQRSKPNALPSMLSHFEHDAANFGLFLHEHVVAFH